MTTLDEKIRDFKYAMELIEFKHLPYFILREPKNPAEISDKLKNHYRFELREGKPVFGFNPESDLPFKIRKSCLARFISYFPDGGIVGRMFKR